MKQLHDSWNFPMSLTIICFTYYLLSRLLNILRDWRIKAKNRWRDVFSVACLWHTVQEICFQVDLLSGCVISQPPFLTNGNMKVEFSMLLTRLWCNTGMGTSERSCQVPPRHGPQTYWWWLSRSCLENGEEGESQCIFTKYNTPYTAFGLHM